MKKRAITWLLAALLALAGTAVAPAASARTRDAGAAIVWIAQERAEQQISLQARETPARPASVPSTYQAPAKSRSFAPSLYQRPPPSLR